jgi:hypothetical protein
MGGGKLFSQKESNWQNQIRIFVSLIRNHILHELLSTDDGRGHNIHSPYGDNVVPSETYNFKYINTFLASVAVVRRVSYDAAV